MGVSRNIQNEYDDRVPLRFVMERLINHPDMIRLFGDQIFEKVRVPSKPTDNYVTIQTRESHIALWAGLPEYIGKVTSIATIYNVRKYPNGRGTEMDFGETMKVLRRATCGIGESELLEVFLANEKIGEIYESAYIRKMPLIEYTEGTFDTLKKGIEIRIVHI